MAHNTKIRNPVTNWTNGSPILPTEFAAFDAALASTINGDDGGTYAPTTPITLSGAFGITGPLVVARGGRLLSLSAAGFRLNDGDYPQLGPNHVGRTRTVVVPCALGTMLPRVAWFPRWKDGGMQSLAPLVDISDGKGPVPARLLVPIRAHDSATLSSVTMNFRIGWPHTQLPGTMPSARVYAATSNGQILPMTSVAAGGDPNGFVFAKKPTSAAAWSGQQTLTIHCDQNNAVSLASRTYYVEIVEEQGLSGYPFSMVVKQPVRLHNIGFPLAGLAGFDGVSSPADGDRILSNVYPQYGIFVAHAGLWTRATDMQQASDFTQGMIVPVQQGDNYGGTYVQAATTSASWSPGSLPADAVSWPFSTAIPFTYGTVSTSNVVPTSGHATGFWYQAQGSGTTSGTEPLWPVTVGQTVVDGSVTWKCMGPAATTIPFASRGLDDVETPLNVGTEMLPHGNIWQSVTVTYTGITQAAFD